MLTKPAPLPILYSSLLACLLIALPLGLPAAPQPRHPCVLIDTEELARLSNQLAQPGWKRDLYRADRDLLSVGLGRGVRANADLWLKRKIQIPARGGHFHNFFCADGDRLKLPSDQRFVPGPYQCPKCGREYSGERYEAALRRMVHVWLSQAALDLALVSALEHKPECAAKSAEILLKYAEAYPGPHTGPTAGGMIYQSLDEAMWLIPLAQAYDLICNPLTAPDRAKIEKFLQAAALGIQGCNVKGNWESWHLSAVGVVGYAIADEDLIRWATRRFKEQIRDELGDDGLWPESVHTYHYFPLLAFIDFAEAAWHSGVDLYHWEAKPGKSLLSMFTAPLAYAYPDLRLPAINDGWFEAFVPPDVYELAYHRTKDPRLGWVLANGYRPGMAPAGLVPATSRTTGRNGLYAFLFGDNIPSDITPPPATSINFPVLGICILRSTNGAMMTFDYGPFLAHGQRDKMGLTLFANHKLWLADYGTPGYGAAILPWYQSTPAHNTIVVDGRNQQPTRENAAQLWLGGQDLEAARSQTSQAYPGVSHTRTVVRIGDYFVISDELTSKTEHTYDLYLHAEGKLLLDGVKPAAVPAEPPSPWITKLSVQTPVPALSGRWSDGSRGIAFCISASAQATSAPPPARAMPPPGQHPPSDLPFTPAAGQIIPITADCPAESGSRKIPLLIARQQANTAEFVTVLAPYQRSPSLSVERQGESIVVTRGGSRDVLTIPRSGSRPVLTRQCAQHQLTGIRDTRWP